MYGCGIPRDWNPEGTLDWARDLESSAARQATAKLVVRATRVAAMSFSCQATERPPHCLAVQTWSSEFLKRYKRHCLAPAKGPPERYHRLGLPTFVRTVPERASSGVRGTWLIESPTRKPWAIAVRRVLANTQIDDGEGSAIYSNISRRLCSYAKGLAHDLRNCGFGIIY
jgi:hypothetical protein